MQLTFALEHRTYDVVITEETLELWLDGCLRKRDDSNAAVLYVWTNIELNWEEHRFVEARYRPSDRRLHITVNRKTVFEEAIERRTNNESR